MASRVNVGLECFGGEKAFKLICGGRVLGTFQLESRGMKKHIKHVLPSSLNDLAALIALYRPGPMKHIKQYSDTKHGSAARVSLHQAVDHLLDETYGVVIYQEQVMLIAQKLAGYSLSEADVLRKAMAKKDMREMLVQRQRFVGGAVANGVKRALAASLFDGLARFADYGFNKSHALAYSALAYITAHLKASFPLEFYAANMSVEIGEQAKMSSLYYEAVSSGIKFVAPSVQAPFSKFKAGNGFIHFPLNAIKGIGEPVAASIAAARGSQPFADLTDFCVRVSPRAVTKRVFKSLIAAGAMDCFGASRRALMASLDAMARCAKSKKGRVDASSDVGVGAKLDVGVGAKLDVGVDAKLDVGVDAGNKPAASDSTLYDEYLALGCYVSA